MSDDKKTVEDYAYFRPTDTTLKPSAMFLLPKEYHDKMEKIYAPQKAYPQMDTIRTENIAPDTLLDELSEELKLEAAKELKQLKQDIIKNSFKQSDHLTPSIHLLKRLYDYQIGVQLEQDSAWIGREGYLDTVDEVSEYLSQFDIR